MERMGAEIEKELAAMPQKLDECVEDGMEHLKIQEHADKVIKCMKEDVVTEQEAELIQEKEMVAPELLPAINDPSEIQDLRMLNEADHHDLHEWFETANEIMPEMDPEQKEKEAEAEAEFEADSIKTERADKEMDFSSQLNEEETKHYAAQDSSDGSRVEQRDFSKTQINVSHSVLFKDGNK